MEHDVKNSIWPAWAFAMVLVLIVAAGPWHLGADAGVRRAPPPDAEAVEANALREGRWTGTIDLN